MSLTTTTIITTVTTTAGSIKIVTYNEKFN
jgi:hypothetical protein